MYNQTTKATDRDRIYSVLNAIPRGQVSSYGKVAAYAQLPNGARLVGRILGQLPKDTTLPWHRVLKANGQIAFPQESAALQRQKQLLEAEDMIVHNGKVNLRKHQWQP
jgi:methylated-DNA-protein-cysteine methyltransferase-like protein